MLSEWTIMMSMVVCRKTGQMTFTATTTSCTSTTGTNLSWPGSMRHEKKIIAVCALSVTGGAATAALVAEGSTNFRPSTSFARAHDSGSIEGVVQSLPNTPETSTVARENNRFATLDELVSTADVVLVATVESVAPGRVAGPEGQQIQMRNVTLTDLEVLKGSITEETLVFEELGWVEKTPTSLNGSRYANAGDRIVAALVQEPHEGTTVNLLASTQSRFFAGERGSIESNYHRQDSADTFVRDTVARYSMNGLVEQLRSIALRAAG